MPFYFHTEDSSYKLPQQRKIKKWLEQVVIAESNTLEEVSVVFCSDDYLYKLNVDYLDHDTLTDIITFEYSSNPVAGDLFISTDRATENALKFNCSTDDEVQRLLVHGTLHLLGYKDKTPEDKKLMTTKEDYYLNLLKTL